MIAVLAQYKDPAGTIFVLKPPDPKSGHQLEIVFKLETMVASFTHFASTVMHIGKGDQIALATPCFDKMHIPKIWLLNSTASELQQEMIIDTGRSVSSNTKEGIGKKGALPAPKEQPKGKSPIDMSPNVSSIELILAGSDKLFVLLRGLQLSHRALCWLRKRRHWRLSHRARYNQGKACLQTSALHPEDDLRP